MKEWFGKIIKRHEKSFGFCVYVHCPYFDDAPTCDYVKIYHFVYLKYVQFDSMLNILQ